MQSSSVVQQHSYTTVMTLIDCAGACTFEEIIYIYKYIRIVGSVNMKNNISREYVEGRHLKGHVWGRGVPPVCVPNLAL